MQKTLKEIFNYCKDHEDCTQCDFCDDFLCGFAFEIPLHWKIEGLEEISECCKRHFHCNKCPLQGDNGCIMSDLPLDWDVADVAERIANERLNGER